MNQGRTVFSQLIAFLPDREFRRCVARYDGDARLRDFSLLGPVSDHGLRSAHLPGEPARYRSMPPGGPGGEPLPNSTDSKRDAFRENAHFTGLHPPGSQNDLLDSANQLDLFEL